jgi:2,4-dienoyl-CoA reductase-like NADH-dependent reductase (Old Yellow Enzyme family)
MGTETLFRPFSCKSLHLKNRIALAPAARWSSPNGNPVALGPFYKRRAEGGVGLVMTEGAAVGRPAAYNDASSARIFGAAMDGWKQVVAEVHAGGAKIIPQLWHCGAVGKKNSDWTPDAEPESPSGLISATQPRGRALTESDIEDLLQVYARAGEDSKRVGFDGVEVHAGHGYLLDQFLWAESNKRTDKWGGKTLPERSRFPIEVMKSVRKAIGPDMPLLARISDWKSAALDARMAETPAELEAWLVPFVKAGVDILSVSSLRYDEPAPYFPNSPLTFAGWVKKVTGVPVIVAGGIGMTGDIIKTFAGETGKPIPLDDVIRRMEAGEFDLIAVGRALVADPQWTRKIEQGRMDLKECAAQTLAPSTAN